ALASRPGVAPGVRGGPMPLGPSIGSIASSPLAPAPAVIRNVSVLPAQESWLKDQELRPSVQSRACFALTTGTSCASAEAPIASDSVEATRSVWAFAVKRP